MYSYHRKEPTIIHQLYFASWQHNIQVQIQIQNVGLQYKVHTKIQKKLQVK